MNKLLKLNVWVVFALLVIPFIAGEISDDQFIKSFCYVIYYVVHYGYYLFTFEACSTREQLGNKVLFYVTTLFLLTFFGFLSIILQPGVEINVTGNLGYISGLIFAASFSYSHYRVAGAQITYTFGKKHLDSWHYFYHIVCFMILPLGIWILYPRLQREYQEEWLRNYRE